ncbi:MAG: redoxin domain-containing protein [Gemmatimonadetes bacterium]|jgi:peroxiredoxin|nr:redoxin domain-containing protein [Gemmatimonadota bacterium]
MLAMLNIAALVLWSYLPASADDYEESTLTRVGQAAPSFVLVTTEGDTLDSAGLRGRVVLINFFATWCPPCLQEIPLLEKKVWERFREMGLVLVAVGREHADEELKAFTKKKGFTLPMAADPQRKVYGQFATGFIPRNYLIDRQGRIAYQSIGFEEEEFAAMVRAVEKNLSSGEIGEE